MAAKKQRTDARFDYLNRLPDNVPPVEHPFWPDHPSDAGGPAEATYYFPIEVMPKGQPNATGVFFPSGFNFPDKLNVIVYFHGHKKGEFKTVNDYWSGRKHDYYLREYLNSTGKQAVLIAPTMGEYPGSSLNEGMGIFRNPGAVDGYLAEVVQWIGKYVPRYVAKKKPPEIDNLVLAGHSGGGGILLHQVMTMRSPVCEVWGFDSMYGWGTRTIRVKGKPMEEDIVVVEWLKAALSHHAVIGLQPIPGFFPIPIPKLRPRTRFYFYWWARNSVGVRALNLQKEVEQMGLHNVKILHSEKVDPSDPDENHFGTVRLNFKRRVAEARCF
jgi:hypothetical protein